MDGSFSPDGATLTIRIPMRFLRRGGRKIVVAPDGATPVPAAEPRPNATLVKALARGHRWRRILEGGKVRTIAELASREGVTDSYVCRLLSLTCLGPAIVELILDGRQPEVMRLDAFLTLPAEWAAQLRVVESTGDAATL